MTFIDTPCRLDVKATCTNRKCNISVLGGPGFCRFGDGIIYLEDHLYGSGISRVKKGVGIYIIRAIRP